MNDDIDPGSLALSVAAPDMLVALKRIRDYLYEREIFGYMRIVCILMVLYSEARHDC